MNFRLQAPRLDFWVDVLREFSGRWLAVGEISGDRELGLGSAARPALAASLGSLGSEATEGLLADPKLFAVGSG